MAMDMDNPSSDPRTRPAVSQRIARVVSPVLLRLSHAPADPSRDAVHVRVRVRVLLLLLLSFEVRSHRQGQPVVVFTRRHLFAAAGGIVEDDSVSVNGYSTSTSVFTHVFAWD